MASADQIPLTLIMDKITNRVVFVEADRDFVDVLLSFLVMPIGTAVKLANSESELGCMDALYQSVERLGDERFSTHACKAMLLNPAIAYGANCDQLPVQIHDNHFNYYVCSDRSHSYCVNVKGSPCYCGKPMDVLVRPGYLDGNPSNVGVFLKGNNKYLITDDLRISTVGSMTKMAEQLTELGVDIVDSLSETKMVIGRDEILQLLKQALISKTPLTDIFVGTKSMKLHKEDNLEDDFEGIKVPLKRQLSNFWEKNYMTLDIVVSKSVRKCLFVQAQEDVANFFFSFLTFPLGLVSNLFDGNSSIGCIDQLRSSAKFLSDKGLLRTKKHANMLLEPQIEPHHKIEKPILRIKEGNIEEYTGMADRVHSLNPKNSVLSTVRGGGYVNGPGTFFISDNLDVNVASTSESLSALRKLTSSFNYSNNTVEAIRVHMGELEALKLLKASLTSSNPLSKVFNYEKKMMLGSTIMIRRNVYKSGNANFFHWTKKWAVNAGPKICRDFLRRIR